MNNILFAFILTALAGLSTGIGSAIAFFAKETNKKFLSISLGFSAGVMIYVSFVEILSKSKDSLSLVLGQEKGVYIAILSFFSGMVLIWLINKFIPDIDHGEEKDINLYKMGVLSALAIAIHNFPEGLATFTAALNEPKVGIPIAVAIAIHNIPEGIAVSIPLYYATGNKKKAFKLSFLSGLTEPLGAIIGFILFRNTFNDLTYGIIFGVVAGIMVYISLDQIIPAAEEYGQHKFVMRGTFAGMIVMATSLVLLM
ncbi:MAG: zinc transporter ZupT [Clostridium argentinense]|uniref:Zinc transporter ZupT n=1 Tax=Clostridium faecium TaxID=2762223 RepID=A0ABR8YP85_9CLOT|nr:MULTISPECIES: zinc transporter ZupT [Clostridium]MBD8046039.1 zinc transporter ZupT [Clostridium faecium]MBS5822888.1 zinc transporter ZupT [Clostridium argentinense]MDU1349099.1 zinc transporter ZupT [Clostridium argentinense]